VVEALTFLVVFVMLLDYIKAVPEDPVSNDIRKLNILISKEVITASFAGLFIIIAMPVARKDASGL